MTVFESMILMLTFGALIVAVFIVIMKFNSIVREKKITTRQPDEQLEWLILLICESPP